MIEKQYSLEKQIEWVFENQDEETKKIINIYKNHKNGYNYPDFLLLINQYIKIWLECKERKVIYDKEWSEITGIERKNLFAFDELTIKKNFNYYPNFVIVVFDQITTNYYVFYPIDLLTINKIRLDRPIERNDYSLKGKWAINLKHGHEFDNITNVVENIYLNFMKNQKEILKQNECYNFNNDVKKLSEERKRTNNYWIKDVNEK